MTVNERLFLSGLLEDFDKAVSNKDVKKVAQILEEIELTEENIEPILEKYELKLGKEK